MSLRSEEPESSISPRPIQVLYSPVPKQKAPVIPSGPEYDASGPLPPQPRPDRAEDGTLLFEGRWRDVFTPNLTPEDMFRGGAFGGAFFWLVHPSYRAHQYTGEKSGD